MNIVKRNKVGIFTPIHKINKEHLSKLIFSLCSQTSKDFVWLVLLNGEVAKKDIKTKLEKLIKSIDPEVLFSIRLTKTESNIGKLKGEACQSLIEDFKDVDLLLELDYDDVLNEHCIEELLKAKDNNPEAHFFFSNFAHFGVDTKGEFTSMFYSEFYGWKRRKHKNSLYFEDNELWEMKAFPGMAQYLYRIESAPNHLRAFTTAGYERVKGYSELEVGDDHDLMCKFYRRFGEKGFVHINKCLYYQRYSYDTTTHLKINDIQKQVELNYIKHSEKMFLKWAKDNELLALDLGGRFNSPKGYKSVDLQDADFIIDLNKTWNLEDNSVGVLRAYHLLEHLDDPIHFFNEAYRVLAPGGFLLIEVPSIKSPQAFADPTHKTFWSELNFAYYCNEDKAKFIRPQYKGAFQSMRLKEYVWPDGTHCVSAQMVTLKGWYNDKFWGTKQTDVKYIKNGHS